MSSVVDRKYQYQNRTIILKRNPHKSSQRYYFEDTYNYIDHHMLKITTRILEEVIKTQCLLPAEIIMIIYQYYISDLILAKNKFVKLRGNQVNYFRNVYLHQGAQLIVSNLYCAGNIIIEKRAMIRAKRKPDRNLSIICKGNLFNRGMISTRYHHGLCTDSGDINMVINGIADSYWSMRVPSYWHSIEKPQRSGFMVKGGRGLLIDTAWDKNVGIGKCVINGKELEPDELLKQFVIADKHPKYG